MSGTCTDCGAFDHKHDANCPSLRTEAPVVTTSPTIHMNKALDGNGMRHNAGKSRMDLICPHFIEGLGDVMRYGAEKYSE